MPEPAPPRAAAAAPRPEPSRARRWIPRILAAFVLLAAAAWGVFTLLFHDPFEGDVPDLARIVPASAPLAIRFSTEDLLAAPFVRRRVLERPEVRSAFSAAGVDEALRRLASEEEALNVGLPGFLKGVSLRADFLSRETVVFGRPDADAPGRSSVVVATRLSPRGKLLASAFKHARVRRQVEEQSGVRIQRYPLVYEIDATALAPDPAEAIPWYAALVRDVLIVGNHRDLVTESARLGVTGGGGSLPDRADAAGALDALPGVPFSLFADLGVLAPPPPPPLTGAGGGDPDDEAPPPPPTLGERLRAAGGLASLLGLAADPDAFAALRVRLRFPGAEVFGLEARGVRGDESLKGFPATLAATPSFVGAAALAEAARLAPEGSAFVVARVGVGAGDALKVLFGRMGPDLRGPAEEGLRRNGSSLDIVAAEMDAVLEPGFSLVLERMAECDALALDTYGAVDGKFVLAVPGVLVAFRQRPGSPDGAAERVLRRLPQWAELETYEDLKDLDPGMTGFLAVPKFLTGDLDLVRPCFAFHGDVVLAASHPGVLRRALEARAGRGRRSVGDAADWDVAAEGTGEGQIAAVVEGGALRAYLRDQRREVATRRSSRDWIDVRRQVHTRVVLSFVNKKEELLQSEIEKLVNDEVTRLQERSRTFDFEEEKGKYEREIEAWQAAKWLSLGLSWDDAGLDARLEGRAGGDE
jgi:hypothetical protein